MALGKQAKILTKKQIDQLIWYVGTLRQPLRNEVIVMLSVRAGLRAKEDRIADMVDGYGCRRRHRHKHSSDRQSIEGQGRSSNPVEHAVAFKLADLLEHERQHHRFDLAHLM